MGIPWIVPWLRRDRISAQAEAFICKHHRSRHLPIPVEDILDIQLQINIVPRLGLTKVMSDDEDDGIESFVNSALTEIFVDKTAYDRQTNRYRFSITHELGHIELHRSIFAQLKVNSIDDWKRVEKSIPEREYARLEWQASCFAGHLLVPTKELTENLGPLTELVMEQGISPNDETVRPFIEKRLADVFRVSSHVIHHRLDEEGLLQ
jgi:Zn-dependent peptidase ImmA (M78 family)